MKDRKVNLDWKAMARPFQEYVRAQAAAHDGRLVYQQNGKLVEENVHSGTVRVLKIYAA